MPTGMVRTRAYASPGCVLLAFDWPDGGQHDGFLGFAIQRDPGYGRDGTPQYLLNKLDFVPISDDSKPKPSDKAPIQKFNWWDGGINKNDRGKTFTYTVTPVIGTAPDDLQLQTTAAGSISVTVPNVRDGLIATYFNRAVVSSQSFTKLKRSHADLEKQMDWLANGLQEAVSDALEGGDSFDCAIYHLTDQRWTLPAFESFEGSGSIVYYDRDTPKSKIDHTTCDALKRAKLGDRISERTRSRIKGLMHDKFIVRYERGQEAAVLTGSANLTPEAFTVQANLLHIFFSKQLADLYDTRFRVLKSDPTMSSVTNQAEWISVGDLPGSEIRVFFSPEPKGDRVSLDTITEAVENAKSSVLFCVFTPTDAPLLNSILAAGDNGKILYGLVNSIPNPTKGAIPKCGHVALVLDCYYVDICVIFSSSGSLRMRLISQFSRASGARFSETDDSPETVVGRWILPAKLKALLGSSAILSQVVPGKDLMAESKSPLFGIAPSDESAEERYKEAAALGNIRRDLQPFAV